MTLTVVSVLARLNIDPWSEAAELARLPKERASQRLVSMIGRVPGLAPAGGQTQKIADRLILLLPCGAAAPLRAGVRTLPSRPDGVKLVLAVLLIIAAALGGLEAANRLTVGSLAKIEDSTPRNAQAASPQQAPGG